MARRISGAYKRTAGTLRPDRVPGIILPPLRALPAPAASMKATARAAWEEFGTAAMKVGTITAQDLGLLSLLARTWADIDDLEQLLLKDGLLLTTRTGATKCHPAAQALDRARILAYRLLDAFGLTPPGRQRLDVRPPAQSAAEQRERRRQERIGRKYFGDT